MSIPEDRIPPMIRPAERPDVASIVEMIGRLAAHHGDTATIGPDELTRDALGPNAWISVLVADAEDALVGYTMLQPTYRSITGQRGLEMHHLFVAGEWRGTGLGRRLVAAVQVEARARGCSFVGVGTALANVAAQRFYRDLGFTPAPPPGPRFRYALPPGAE